MFKKFFTLLPILFCILFFEMMGKALADATDLLEQAATYQEEEQYEQAEVIYQQIVTDYSVTDYAFQAQKNLAILYVAWDKQPQAEAALQKLLADFSKHEGIAQAVHDIAYQHRLSRKNEKANQLDQHVIDNWPESDYAVLAQMDMAKYYVDQGDVAAEAAVDKLLADFPDSPFMARAVHDVAQHYSLSGKYQKANELYQHVIDHWPKAEHAMWSQVDLIKSNLALGRDGVAQVAVDKLLANFTDNPLIAQAVHDIAYQHRLSRKNEKANQLDQHVIDNWPEAEHAILSQIGIAETNVLSLIESGNDTAIEATLDSLIADFNDNPGLPETVFVIGEKYYNKAFRYDKEGLDTKARDSFTKAIVVWGKIITELPESIATAWAYNFGADCYRRLGQHKKAIEYYQKVVDDWPDYEHASYALFSIGHIYEDLKKSGAMSKSEADSKTRTVFQQLLEKYPACKAAKAAELWLSSHK